ncbi:hypothetical protein MP228_003025 [Amoeboaphelidium protococcarum]|nr:hypothetical protein MP228_003025 [Amoeboaphelidium protococcarum]
MSGNTPRVIVSKFPHPPHKLLRVQQQSSGGKTQVLYQTPLIPEDVQSLRPFEVFADDVDIQSDQKNNTDLNYQRYSEVKSALNALFIQQRQLYFQILESAAGDVHNAQELTQRLHQTLHDILQLLNSLRQAQTEVQFTQKLQSLIKEREQCLQRIRELKQKSQTLLDIRTTDSMVE